MCACFYSHHVSWLSFFFFFKLCCSCYSWALQRVFKWRKCLSGAAHYGQAKHFLRSHNLIALHFPHIFPLMFFQCLVFWPKSDDLIDSTFPRKGSRLCLCNIVLLFHWKTLAHYVSSVIGKKETLRRSSVRLPSSIGNYPADQLNFYLFGEKQRSATQNCT